VVPLRSRADRTTSRLTHTLERGSTVSTYIERQVEERNRAWNEASVLISTAATEKRDLNADEQTKYDNIISDMDQRDLVIKRMIADEARDAEIRSAVAGHVEARPEMRDDKAAVADDAEVIRRLAKGEIRSASFETRAVSKSSTGSPVPTSFYDRVIEVARFVGPMLEEGFILNTTSGENLQIPRTNAYSTGSVTAEAAAFASSDPTFSAFLTLGAFKESTFFQVSTEMLDDTGVDILGYIATNIGQALGYAANANLTTGTGTVQPTGIVTSAAAGVTGATAVVGAFTYANVVDLVYSTDAAVRRMPGFKIMGSTGAISALRKLVDTTGQPLWQPALIAGEPNRLLGYEIVENPHMATPATSAVSLIAGDMKSFIVRQVGGIQLDRSDDYAFGNGLVTFRATMRLDSGTPQVNHIKKFTGGAT
jgi:HK97 family phage major capsid protein